MERFFEKAEAMRYMFWGMVTVAVNYLSYLLLKLLFPYHIANLISIIFTKIFAYCTNRKYVFQTKTDGKAQVQEVIRYVLGRSLTGIVDFVGLIFLTELLFLDDRVGKAIMIVVTTALNYFMGKVFVFKK